ncbi:hypothetical protein V8F33_003787 [Rhypophila sp. PSN 637]
MDRRGFVNNGRYEGYGASSPGPPNQGGNMAPARQEAPHMRYDPALNPNIHPELAAQLGSVGPGHYDPPHFNTTRGIAPRLTVYHPDEEEREDEAGQGSLGQQPNTGPHHYQPATIAPNDTLHHVKNEYQDPRMSDYEHADRQHADRQHHQYQQHPAHALPHRPQHQFSVAPMQTIYQVDPNQGMHVQHHPHQQQHFQQPVYPHGAPEAVFAGLYPPVQLTPEQRDAWRRESPRIRAAFAGLYPPVHLTPEQRDAWIRENLRIRAAADAKRRAEEEEKREEKRREAYMKTPAVEAALDNFVKLLNQVNAKTTSDTADRNGAGTTQGGEEEEQLTLDQVVYDIMKLVPEK